MTDLENFIAQKLLALKAVKLQPQNPFQWNTGWMSPIYFDSRTLLSYPPQRNIFKVELARLVAEKYPEAEVIAGVAPNAIGIGMLVAEELGLPFVYVFPHPKDHGLENRIEGEMKPRQKVVIIEDQLSLGSNSLLVQDAIRRDGSYVIGMVSIFDYAFEQGQLAFQEAELEYVALTNFNAIIDNAINLNRITTEEAQIIREWHNKPGHWMIQKAPVKTKYGKKK